MKKIVALTLEQPFSHWTSNNWKIWVENSVFAIQHIENRKSLLKCFPPPPPRDQTNPFAYSCSFTLHTSYKNGMIGHRGGGNAVKMLKNTVW